MVAIVDVEGSEVECALGCTDACPGEADGHSFELSLSHTFRTHAEWTSHDSLRREWDTKGLPAGWLFEARLEQYTGTYEDLDLVRVPSYRSVGTSEVVPGFWATLRRNQRVKVAQVMDTETSLWRLLLKVRRDEANGPWDPFDDSDVSVAEWLEAFVATQFDFTDPDQAAEATLYALAGRLRTPPPAALLRP